MAERMIWRTALLALLALALGSPQLVVAQQGAQGAPPHGAVLLPFAAHPVYLEGRVARVTQTIDRRLPGTLLLDLALAPRLELAQSRLAVLLDGRVAFESSLADLDITSSTPPRRAHVEVLLGFERGRHVVTIETELRVEDDPCQLRPESSWLRVEPTSAFAFGESDSLTLANLREAWQRHGGEVEVHLEDIRGEPHFLALLELVDLVHDWGLVPIEHREARRRGAILARVDPDSPALGDTQAHGAWWLDGDTLHVVSRSPERLPQAIAALRDDTARALCPDGAPCRLPLNEVPQLRRQRMTSVGPETVYTLADAGHERGYSARGSGHHRLRFGWTVPAHWDIGPTAKLLLDVVLPTRLVADRTTSYVLVSLADTPIGTFALPDESHTHARFEVSLPPESFSDRRWDFEVDVVLAEPDAARCSMDPASAAWLTLAPSSSIQVERSERASTGVAAVIDDLAARPRITGELPHDLARVRALSTLLTAVRREHPGEHWQTSARSTGGVEVRLGAPSDFERDATAWRSGEAGRALPWLDRDSVTLIRHAAGGLELALGTDLAWVDTRPDMVDFTSQLAVCLSDRCVVVPDPDTPEGPIARVVALGAPDVSPASTTRVRVPSEEEALRHRLNLVWALATATLLLAALAWLWLRRGRSAPIEQLPTSKR